MYLYLSNTIEPEKKDVERKKLYKIHIRQLNLLLNLCKTNMNKFSRKRLCYMKKIDKMVKQVLQGVSY
jgi:ribosomal protein L22